MVRRQRPEPRTDEERAAEHRRQVGLQIWLPLALGLLVAFGLVALTILGAVRGSSEVNRWGNLSAVYLLIPTLLTSLISLTLLILSIRGLGSLARKMPGWLKTVQAFMRMVSFRVRVLADQLVKPVIGIGSAASAASAPFKRKKPERFS